jgi:pimeloyl-ACP methyl ester carboxylesterase
MARSMPEVLPFRVHVPDDALADLRARLEAARWIDDVFEGEWQCGAPVSFVRALSDHWLNRFDWRALEARLNREEHVVTEIDGMTIHAMMRRSRRPDAVPLMLLHGWPSSFLEFLDLYEPLTNPPSGVPAFHVITPSLPGYGFSTTRRGLTPQSVAQTMVTLMERLSYDRFIVQGGDWGSLFATEVARQHPERLIGLHLNLVSGGVPDDWQDYPLTELERDWVATLGSHVTYPHMMLQGQSPASLAHAQNDSPAGLAAWIGEKIHDWIDPDGLTEPFVPYDKLLETIALYWFTQTAASSALMYYDVGRVPWGGGFVEVPTAGAIFPKEVAKLPRVFAEKLYNLVQWTLYPHGGHFPALEHSDWLVEDLRKFAALLSR